MSNWTYHTAERMGWSRWTRKRKRKFKKRYFKQHGHRFRWFVSEWKFVAHPMYDWQHMIFFERAPNVGLGATVKHG